MTAWSYLDTVEMGRSILAPCPCQAIELQLDSNAEAVELAAIKKNFEELGV